MPAVITDSENHAESVTSDATFLDNLEHTFHVHSKVAALLILIIICIGAVIMIIFTIMFIRTCVRHRYDPKRQKRRLPSIYVDDIPGLSNKENKKFGLLKYSLQYSLKNEELQIGVIEAQDLVNPQVDDTLDTYVIVTVLSTTKSQVKQIGNQESTQVIEQSHRPCWQKIFAYKIAETELQGISIIFEIFNYDSLGQDVSVGKLQAALRDHDQSDYVGSLHEAYGWLDQADFVYCGLGEMCIGMAYYPNHKRIDICVYECRQLELQTVLCKKRQYALDILLQLRLGKQIIAKTVTCARKELVNPYFCHKSSFNIENKPIEKLHLLCTLRYIGRMNSKHALGNICIGTNSSLTTGVKQWEEMMAYQTKMHVKWHSIIPTK